VTENFLAINVFNLDSRMKLSNKGFAVCDDAFLGWLPDVSDSSFIAVIINSSVMVVMVTPVS